MVKKKRIAKKPSKKRKVSKAKKQSRSVIAKSKKQKAPLKNIDSRLRKSNKSLIYAVSVFVISMVLFSVTGDLLESVFGIIAIFSGALIILFGITSLILLFLKRK